MKKRRLSSYDRLLLFALAIGVLLVYVRYRTLSDSPLTGDGEKAAVTYTLQTSSKARAETLARAKELSFADTDSLLGYVEEPPEIRPAYTEALRADGTVAYLPSNAHYEVRGTFIAEGSFTENGFFANGQRHITANQSISAQMNGLNVTILVLNVHHFSSK